MARHRQHQVAARRARRRAYAGLHHVLRRLRAGGEGRHRRAPARHPDGDPGARLCGDPPDRAGERPEIADRNPLCRFLPGAQSVRALAQAADADRRHQSRRAARGAALKEPAQHLRHRGDRGERAARHRAVRPALSVRARGGRPVQRSHQADHGQCQPQSERSAQQHGIHAEQSGRPLRPQHSAERSRPDPRRRYSRPEPAAGEQPAVGAAEEERRQRRFQAGDHPQSVGRRLDSIPDPRLVQSRQSAPDRRRSHRRADPARRQLAGRQDGGAPHAIRSDPQAQRPRRADHLRQRRDPLVGRFANLRRQSDGRRQISHLAGRQAQCRSENPDDSGRCGRRRNHRTDAELVARIERAAQPVHARAQRHLRPPHPGLPGMARRSAKNAAGEGCADFPRRAHDQQFADGQDPHRRLDAGDPAQPGAADRHERQLVGARRRVTSKNISAASARRRRSAASPARRPIRPAPTIA